jgi:hypothetical protein
MIRLTAVLLLLTSGLLLAEYKQPPEAMATIELDARGTIELYVTAALAGKVDDAAKLAVHGSSPQSPAKKERIEEFKAMVDAKAIKFPTVLAGKQQAIAVSEGVKLTKAQPDGTDKGVLIFALVKSDDEWLVKDIDFRTEESAKDQVEKFKKKYPDAKNVPSKEAEESIAWGKEVGGLQAGLGFRAGEKRAYQHYETVTLVLRVRNVGKEQVRLQYVKKLFMEEPPILTNSDGIALALSVVPMEKRKVEELDVAPGKDVEIDALKIDLRPDAESDVGDPPSVAIPYFRGTGKFHVTYERLAPKPLDNIGSKLATGKLELEVKEAEKPPQKGLPQPKVEKKR